jgi:hypothetical protein
LDGISNSEGDGIKSGSSKGPARALPVVEGKSRSEKLPGIPGELQPGLTLPDPGERRKILERAGLLIAEARSLLERLDGTAEKSAAISSAEKSKNKPSRSVESDR